jgi:hypothetical protein
VHFLFALLASPAVVKIGIIVVNVPERMAYMPTLAIRFCAFGEQSDGVCFRYNNLDFPAFIGFAL